MILLGGGILYVAFGFAVDSGVVGKHAAKVLVAITANPPLMFWSLGIGFGFATYKKFIILVLSLSAIIIPITYFNVAERAELLGTPMSSGESVVQFIVWFVAILLCSHFSNLLRLGIERLRKS